MAEMAENVWAMSGGRILDLLDEFQDYGFDVVGHSLGAGTATLLTVQCYTQQLVPGRMVRCFAFAPPPTLSLQGTDNANNLLVERAIENTVAYLHDNDCVPFLSIGSVRRLINLLDTVDNRTEHIWAFKRFRIFWGWEAVPQDIVHDVHAKEAVPSETIAIELAIPALMVIWMKRNDTGSYEAFACNRLTLARQNIFVNSDMLSDHLVEPYEDALDTLVAK